MLSIYMLAVWKFDLVFSLNNRIINLGTGAYAIRFAGSALVPN